MRSTFLRQNDQVIRGKQLSNADCAYPIYEHNVAHLIVDGRHVQTYQSSGTSLQKCQLPVPYNV